MLLGAEDWAAVPLVVLDPAEPGLEQVDDPGVLDPTVALALELAVLLVGLDDLIRYEVPLTGPPNAASDVMLRRILTGPDPAAGSSADAASFGAVETVASTSLAMAWIAVGVAAEDAFGAPGGWCMAGAAFVTG